MLRIPTLLAGAFVAFSPLATEARDNVKIDPMKHYVKQIYANNFDNVISSHTARTVSMVWYYRDSNRADADLLDKIDKVAQDANKMITIGAMDCDANAKHCDREGVKEGGVMIYPQAPRPKFKYDGDASDADTLSKFLYKLIPGDKISTMKTADEYNNLKKKSPTKVKVVLFSDKKKAPSMFRALSTDSVFTRTVEFAFVGPDGAEAAKAAGADKKKAPAIQMITKGAGKWYKEKEITFSKLHEWINLFSESGMGDTVKGAAGAEEEMEEPEWEKVRELHNKSQGDLCFKQKNVCAIFIQKGAALDDKVADKIVGYESKFAPKSDRGIRYNWMWMDIDQESEFKTALVEQEKKQAEKEGRDVEEFTYPTMIFVKPPKKKREEKLLSYIRVPTGTKVDESSVGDIVERISGGAMYTRVDLPRMTIRQPAAKKGAKKEEL